MIAALNDIEGIGISELTGIDIVRNPIIVKILGRLDNIENGIQK
jgi:phosphate starvation-inducible protein PhoH